MLFAKITLTLIRGLRSAGIDHTTLCTPQSVIWGQSNFRDKTLRKKTLTPDNCIRHLFTIPNKATA